MDVRTTQGSALGWPEQTALEALIDEFIVSRYEGDLERLEGCDGEISYLPLDEDEIRQLLTALWGEYITTETIDAAFERLTQDGAEEWPRGYCEEDAEREEQERLELLDREEEEKEEHEKHLRWVKANYEFLNHLERWLHARMIDQGLVAR